MVSDSSTPTREEMQEKLGGQREQMLTVLNRTDDGVLDTSTLRQHADIPTGSINHHLDLLTRWGLIEQQPDREYTGHGGSRARVWRLTEEGEEFIEDYDAPLSPLHGDETADRIRTLENRIADLEDETRQRRQIIIDILQVISHAQDDETQEQVQQILTDAGKQLS